MKFGILAGLAALGLAACAGAPDPQSAQFVDYSGQPCANPDGGGCVTKAKWRMQQAQTRESDRNAARAQRDRASYGKGNLAGEWNTLPPIGKTWEQVLK